MTSDELCTLLEDIRAQLGDLNARVSRLEGRQAPPPVETSPPPPALSEEKLLAISAAIAAYLGVHVHIRQIRLVSSPAWAQQGRVWVQASHQIHHE
jgi:methylmalonyl-CoA carboxyltransferase 12S subunit